jgi:predicted glycosyltransferase
MRIVPMTTADARPSGHRRPESAERATEEEPEGRARRVALYSPGMVGLGHMRRNLLIATRLARMPRPFVPLLIAEAREASIFAVPAGIDCITLPGLTKEPGGHAHPRNLDVPLRELVRLRSQVIRAALASYSPDIFIADHLPLGAYHELLPALELLRSRGTTRIILGLRPVLGDPETVRREWEEDERAEAIRRYYSAVAIYGDRRLYDPAAEYAWPHDLRAVSRYLGYVDPRERIGHGASATAASLVPELPVGRMMLCMVGGGQDGDLVAEMFAQATLPDGAYGVIVTGPFMAASTVERLESYGRRSGRMIVLRLVDEAAHLLERADRVVAMGGYNSLCEVLAFGRPALIVPRDTVRREQTIHAQVLADAGFATVLPSSELTPGALTEWLHRELPAPLDATSLIDFGGLDGIAALADELAQGIRRVGATRNGDRRGGRYAVQ